MSTCESAHADERRSLSDHGHLSFVLDRAFNRSDDCDDDDDNHDDDDSDAGATGDVKEAIILFFWCFTCSSFLYLPFSHQ
jgi:hypothetical protein